MDLVKVINHIVKVLEGKNLFYLTPLNLRSEKEKFLLKLHKGESYNPQFKYRKILFDLTNINSEIDWLLSYKGKYSKIISDAAKRFKLFLSLIESRGTDSFTKFSEQLYGYPSNNEIKYAREILSNISNEKNQLRTHDSKFVKSEFAKIIKKYNYHIELADIPSKMKINHIQNKLIINKSTQFSNRDIERLKWHEIETHIKREFNNKKLPVEIRKCFNYIETEEGLAVKMEEIHGCLSYKQMKIYAGRLIATNLTLKNSFFEVFESIKSLGFDNETSFSIALRVKRGLTDTSKMGGFTKDRIYLSGKMKIDKFINNKGNIDDLFIGKISIDDIKSIKKINSRLDE